MEWGKVVGKSQLWKGFKFGVAGLHVCILTCGDSDLDKIGNTDQLPVDWPSHLGPGSDKRHRIGCGAPYHQATLVDPEPSSHKIGC